MPPSHVSRRLTQIQYGIGRVDALLETHSLQPEPLPVQQKYLYHGRDPWLIAIVAIAFVMSLLATGYAFQHHYILLYNDAYAHLRLARAVFDNVNPGFAQLGGAWLPLPHLLMLPFIWNDYLWQTGLAGSILSMGCYLVTAIFLFLSARRLTHNNAASFIGTLAFIINPNVLYLQTTPLGEMMCMAAVTMACSYMLAWIQEARLKYLLLAAGSTCLATLIRYDGWALFLALLLLSVLIACIKRKHWTQVIGNLFAFGIVGGLGIGLWLLWEKDIFGNPLYFFNGPYSSKAGQAIFFYYHSFYTYHNLLKSCLFYLVASVETIGPILFVGAIIGAIAFLIRRTYTLDMLIILAWLVPFGFYVVSFYTGSVPIFVPEVVPATSLYHLFNVRYAVHMVAPEALFLAVLASQSSKIPLFRRYPIGYGALLAVLVLQTILTSSTGILSLQDGLHGVSCAPQHQIVIYLAQHYDKGQILDDTSSTNTSFEDAGIEFKNIIYVGSGHLWLKALNDPTTVVDWIVTKPGDTVSQHINVKSLVFLRQYTFVMKEATGIRLYHRSGTAPLPTRSIPSYLLTNHQSCGTGGH